MNHYSNKVKLAIVFDQNGTHNQRSAHLITWYTIAKIYVFHQSDE